MSSLSTGNTLLERICGAFLLLILLLVPGELPGQDRPLRVVTTLPVLADLVRQIGGSHVQVRSLARGGEDPHYVVPTPSLMAAVNKADLFVEVGLSLELWAEHVLDGARNASVRRGSPGHVFAATGLTLLQVPSSLTRARGDLHPEGNPHVWMDPLNLPLMAGNIADGLSRVAPARKARWEDGLEAFKKRIQVSLYGEELLKLLGGNILDRLARGWKLWNFLESKSYKGKKLTAYAGGWLAKARSLRGVEIVYHHQSWAYFNKRFGLHAAGYIEERPGIPPSAAHKADLIQLMRKKGVKVIGILTYYDDSVAAALARETGAHVAVLAGNVGALPGTEDVFKMIDRDIDLLLAALKP